MVSKPVRPSFVIQRYADYDLAEVWLGNGTTLEIYQDSQGKGGIERHPPGFLGDTQSIDWDSEQELDMLILVLQELRRSASKDTTGSEESSCLT